MDIKGEGDRVDETTGFDHHDGEEEVGFDGIEDRLGFFGMLEGFFEILEGFLFFEIG